MSKITLREHVTMSQNASNLLFLVYFNNVNHLQYIVLDKNTTYNTVGLSLLALKPF